jgi:nucleotide-binding universal stress UspA family protein
MLSARNILVPTDFSPQDDKALELGVDIARHNDGKVRLLHVVDPVQQCAADFCLPNETVASLEEQLRAAADEDLKKAQERFGRDGVKITREVAEGIPYREILKEERDQPADLIVISSHKRHGLRERLMGSAADKVMKGASCDVVRVQS